MDRPVAGMSQSSLPVAVIGAGPVGLAAAAHLVSRGETPMVFESGPSVGDAVLRWGHVRLFSPWSYLVDAVAGSLLAEVGWAAPDAATYPTGRELVDQYLMPLADLPQIRPHLRLDTRVLKVARRGLDKMKSPGREDAPFVLRVRSASGEEEDVLARAVIDASGTYDRPNVLGVSGIPALGEVGLGDRIFYGIPDVLGIHRDRYAGRRVLVVGSGHSAFNVLLDLIALRDEEPSTTILWAIRRRHVGELFGSREHDQLPARSQLGERIRQLLKSGTVHLLTDVHIEELHRSEDGVVVVSQNGPLPAVDEIVATTGFRPDLSLLGELRTSLDPALESPVALAPLIDPNVHSCGTVPPHGVDELSHPEHDLYIVGMKSYGRAPTFLTLTGYEQVRSIVAALAGDWESARDVQLVLPETGVCSVDRSGASSCAPEPSLATAGANR